MSFKNHPLSPLLIEKFERDYLEIIEAWVANEKVVSALQKHHIKPGFFKKHFAMKFFFTYLQMFKGKTEAGICPIIYALIHFSIHKFISLSELFTIFTEFKNVLVHYAVYTKMSTQNREENFENLTQLHQDFWALVNIMDLNFNSIIENYLNSNYQIPESHVSEYQVSHQSAIETNFESLNLGLSERMKEIRYSKEERYDSQTLFEMVDESIGDKIEQFVGDLDEALVYLYDIQEKNLLDSKAMMQNIVMIFDRFYKLVDMFVVFPVITSTFKNLAIFLEELENDFYTDSAKKDMLIHHLIGIVLDLEKWIDIVFIKRIADDVHYFDASFANNVLEIESINNPQMIVSKTEEDLEFF